MMKKCIGVIFLIFLMTTFSSIAKEISYLEIENTVLDTLEAEYNILKTGIINQRNIVPNIQSVRLNEGYEYLDELVERHKRIIKSGLSISDLSIKILNISTEVLDIKYSSNVKVDVSYKLSSFEDEKLEVVTEEIKNYEFVFNKINSENFLLEKYTIVEAFESTNPLLYQDEDVDFPVDVTDEPLDFNRILNQKYPEEDTERAYYGYNSAYSVNGREILIHLWS